MRISKKYIELIVLFSILIEPAYFARITVLNTFWWIGKSVCGAYVIICSFSQKDKIRVFLKDDLSFVLMFGYIIVNTIVHKEFSTSTIESLASSMILIVIIALNISRYRLTIVKSLAHVTALYMVMNFITVVLYPQGLYSTYSIYENEYICWLLGYKNPIGRFVIMTLGINMCYCFMKDKKIGWKQFFLGVVGIWTVILVDSATTLLTIVLFYVFVIFFRNIELPKFVNLYNVFLMVGVLTFAIYVWNIQNLFAFLIIKLLRRNLSLTSRIYIWERTIKMIKGSLLFGYGIQPASEAYRLIKASHPHNYYLYQLYTGGIVGLILVGFMIYTVSQAIRSKMMRILPRICLFIMSAIMIMGISESLTQMPLLYPLFFLSYHLSLGDYGITTISEA